MGAGTEGDAEAFENERWSPAAGSGTVVLPTFFIASTETTVAQFAAFVQASSRPRSPCDRGSARLPGAIHLVARRAGLLPLAGDHASPRSGRAGGGRRSAASGLAHSSADRGAVGEGGTRWRRAPLPWGAEPRRDRANYDSGAVASVGQFPCPDCAYGLRDMSGNVWEWTSSPYQPYPYTETDDRTNLEADALWVMRGGHYGDAARMVRTTARGAAEPGARRPFIGFRVALVPPR